jgi:hypothetical protein
VVRTKYLNFEQFRDRILEKLNSRQRVISSGGWEGAHALQFSKKFQLVDEGGAHVFLVQKWKNLDIFYLKMENLAKIFDHLGQKHKGDKGKIFNFSRNGGCKPLHFLNYAPEAGSKK